MATPRINVSSELSADALQAIIADNASYRSDSDQVKARNLIDAAEVLLAIPLTEFDHAGERARVEIRVVQDRLTAAIEWLEVEKACAAPPHSYVPARNWKDD